MMAQNNEAQKRLLSLHQTTYVALSFKRFSREHVFEPCTRLTQSGSVVRRLFTTPFGNLIEHQDSLQPSTHLASDLALWSAFYYLLRLILHWMGFTFFGPAAGPHSWYLLPSTQTIALTTPFVQPAAPLGSSRGGGALKWPKAAGSPFFQSFAMAA